MIKKKLGFCFTGSFCTLSEVLKVMESMSEEYDILPVVSEHVYQYDTRFGDASCFLEMIEKISGKKTIHTVVNAEPIGPKGLTDVMLIAPCTGNTLAKLSYGITDGAVTMAAKSHLRVGKPLVLAIATNDALGASAQNIGRLLNTRNIYFVPFSQDNSVSKPRSMIADFARIGETINAAMEGRQLQPIIF